MNFEESIKLITRGTEEIIPLEDLEKKIKSGRKLNIKLGIDPTAPDLHLGHTVVLRKLKNFQDLGHNVILIIGDFTTLIGDPTGKSKTRPALSADEIKKNAQTYKTQAFKILDEKKTIIKYNSEWLSKISLEELIKISAKFTVARILERETFSQRLKTNEAISLHEILYPLLQAYDSVAIKADVELGGTDQTFNLLIGRDLMEKMGMEPQVCLTMPIIAGLDGKQKMSKSLGNYVGIAEDPKDIFGKLMSIPDELLRQYFILLTDFKEDEISGFFERYKNPKDIKKILAFEITKMYSSEEEALKAKESFETAFEKRTFPKDAPVYKWPYENENEVWLPKLLVDLGLLKSSSEGKRLISQGAIEVDEETVTDEKFVVKKGDHRLKVGRKMFLRIY
ncbi:Tyrosyl-tRNA synthetase [Thermodesulfobium narugense DSM 14796]|uniref:Tyrosine--tRNA ligase n=1 Tax=Thermodesulfobium narugense DSM 14796 TaxID=747365 RepID=M1E8J6_9BACT|nr:tyrosine--tRNA ligase [Thermodesulfobium narugense]AEE14514.1 Tyrosyl-tRNA synthetase [Thermodesulfobium narugense DSM 14796]